MSTGARACVPVGSLPVGVGGEAPKGVSADTIGNVVEDVGGGGGSSDIDHAHKP